jgi:DNA-binding transcriptional ArsR family regulator
MDLLSSTLAALADPTRRGILARLARGDATVNELAAPFDMSLAAVSKHIKVLEGAGLVTRSREAQSRPCHLAAEPLQAVAVWLEDYRRFWDRSLDALEDYLAALQARPAAPRDCDAATKPRGRGSRRSRSKGNSR